MKIKLILFLFYLGNKTSNKFLYFIIKFFYKLIVEYILNIELPLNTKVGKNLRIDHGQGLVVNVGTIIGENVTLKHNTTIGCKNNYQNKCIKQSVIEDNVTIHPHTCIIGATIGKNSIIGAGSIVTKDIPPNSIAVGNPCRVIKVRDDIVE